MVKATASREIRSDEVRDECARLVKVRGGGAHHLVRLFAFVAVGLAGAANGQVIESYSVNDGKNDTQNPEFGEFGPDLGGAIYFSRYADGTSGTGHYYARSFPGGGPAFVNFMYDALMDFDRLVATLVPSVAPTFANGRVVKDPRAVDHSSPTIPPPPLPFPIRAPAWFTAAGSSNAQEVLYWPYIINGGALMVCMGGDGNGNPIGSTTKAMMVVNYYNHPSYFGANANRFEASNPGGWAREFSRVSSNGNAPFAEAWWEGQFGPAEQAIRAGDVVVFVQENYGMAISTALARSQESVWFMRNVFATAVPGYSPPLSLTIDGAYLHGTSFGQAMAGFLALAQPQYYRGVVNWITSDLGFELGDFSELQSHFSASMDRGGFYYKATTDEFFPDMYAFIDQLGIRFDDPQNGQAGWDIAAFSLNRRPQDVKIPMSGGIGEHEFQFPGCWSVNDPSLFASGASTSLRQYRNRAHEEAFGVIPGHNEYSIFDGTEWAAAKNSNAPATINRIVPLPPSAGGAPAPLKPYPDPYSHTLRPVAGGPVGGALLTQIDARAGMDGNDAYHGNGYRHPATGGAPTGLKSIGHGLMLGYRDQMRVADLDADGEMEVVFGNLDGYVHVLEFAGNGATSGSIGNADDPYRLIDEWQSPRLGRAVFACDAQFNASTKRATLFFADARGQIWKILATGKNSYQVANTGMPIAAPDPMNPPLLYDGSTPQLLVGDFDGGSSGSEVLVMNRFFDWSLFTTNGAPIGSSLSGRLTRSTRTNGPVDAYVAESDGDSPKEVFLASLNGGAWILNRVQQGPQWQWTDQSMPLIQPTPCARLNAIPCNFNGSQQPPTHLISLCINDDRTVATAPPGIAQGPELVELYSVSFSAAGVPTTVKLADIDGGGDSFAWIDRPKVGSSIASFAVAGARSIQTIAINTSAPTGSQLIPLVTRNLAAEFDPDVLLSDGITSIDCASLEGYGGVKKCIVYATRGGRIHVVDADTLAPLRDSTEEFGTLPTPYSKWDSWPSNRTLSNVAACDLVQPLDANGQLIPDKGNLYFAEYATPSLRETVGANTLPRYRIGRIGLGTTATAENEWQPFVARAKSGDDWETLRPTWTRTLQVDDFVNASGGVGSDGQLEFRLFTETGVAFVDHDGPATPVVREFQWSARAPKSIGGPSAWLGAFALQYPAREQIGGRVFEMLPDRKSFDYWHLSFVDPPPDPVNNPFFVRSGGGAAWWYPGVGTVAGGQLASNMQSAHELDLGASMTVAMIRSGPSATAPTPHVVAGTAGGHVYAIEPTSGPPTSSSTTGVPSDLRQVSSYLGSYIIGLAAGNLDADPDEEVVCGTFMDTGTYTDWDPSTPDLTKNRAHLHVLDPNVTASSPAQFNTIAVLDGDDLVGAGKGIGSGVTGVRIDDVDGDGDREIWCSDATGYLFLFAKDAAGGWHCVHRSDDFCSHPGFYNNIHPIKGVGGKTTKLAVQSPGYFLLFAVNSSAIVFP